MLSIADIQERLAAYRPTHHVAGADTRQAAVALILRARSGTDGRSDILFIRRAVKEGDPWSGHMAFPGGHMEPSDDSLLHAATRETREEINLDLERHGTRIGTLDHQRAAPRGRPIDMLIAPFVFALDHEPPFRPNHEVAEVVWTPLEPIVRGANHTHEERIVGGRPTRFSGYRINGGHFVWGLTYRVIHSFFEALDPTWTAP